MTITMQNFVNLTFMHAWYDVYDYKLSYQWQQRFIIDGLFSLNLAH